MPLGSTLYHFVLIAGVSNGKVTGVSLVADNPMGREAFASEKVNLSDSKRVGESPSLIAATPLSARTCVWENRTSWWGCRSLDAECGQPATKPVGEA